MATIYYTLVFYLLFFSLTYSYFNTEQKKISKQNVGIYAILAIALIFRLLISTSIEGHPTDISCFKSWAERLAEVGMRKFYSDGFFADYPPGYMLVLYVIGKAARLFGLEGNALTLLLKLPAIIADIALGYIIYKNAVTNQSKKSATVLMLLVVFNPAVIINSAIWGQIDSFFTLFMVLSLVCVYYGRYPLGAILYTLCALIKPQAFIVAPVFLCAYLSAGNWRVIVRSGLASLATVFIVSLPFTSGLDFTWLFQKYAATLKSYPYATVNAYNFYALIGYNWKEITTKLIMLPVSYWSYIVMAGITAGSIWFYFSAKDKAKIFYMAYLIIAAMFTFGAKMHERYMYPAIILLALTYAFKKDKRLIFLLMAQFAAHYLNVGDVLICTLRGSSASAGVTAVCAALHIGALAYSVYIAYDIFSLKRRERRTYNDKTIESPKLIKADYIIMAAITLVYGIFAFAGLGDKSAPQTFAKTANEAVVDMGREHEISSVLMYLGIGDGKHYIQASRDGVTWNDYGVCDHDSVFVWRRVSGEATARYLKLTADKPGLMLGEIGVTGSDGGMVSAVSLTAPRLTDEQAVVPTKPSYMNGTYFDEIYHPRTAYEVLHRIKPYEITHPPLGKVIMSLGIMLFGMTPFGWRFTGTVAGILMVPLFFLICKRLVKRTDFAALGTVLFAFDFMHYAQTRLGTVDSYAVLLIMLMYYYIYEYYVLDFNKEPLIKGLVPLALCGVAFGVGAATKWICIYSALGLAAIILSVWIRAYISPNKCHDYSRRLAKTVAWCVLFFIVIPALIYFASYLPQMRYDLNGKTPLQYVAENQSYMLNYHKGVTDDHPYSSKWYEWVADKRPLWAYIDGELQEKGVVSSISSFGNPIVWWGGFLAVLGCIYIGFLRKDSNGKFLIAAYFSQLVPWLFVSRVLFIYHYFACVPFLVLALIYYLKYLYEKSVLSKRFIYCYCAAAVLLFIMFYPVISGRPADRWYVQNVLKWFDSWTFIN